MTRPIKVRERGTGRLVYTKQHVISWHGKHDVTKAKVLMVLYACWQKRTHLEGLCIGDLTAQPSTTAGVSPSTLNSELPDWIRWNYVSRKTKEYHGKPVFSYFIDNRGRKFVERRIPPAKLVQFKAEILEARAKLTVFKAKHIKPEEKP